MTPSIDNVGSDDHYSPDDDDDIDVMRPLEGISDDDVVILIPGGITDDEVLIINIIDVVCFDNMLMTLLLFCIQYSCLLIFWWCNGSGITDADIGMFVFQWAH